ncbi:glucose-1-phosphate thymidylyltransferase RfbA [uncultured Mailhella sp.]|uniref:glucose-1-phosphate thymidylyltransferase RfbA n=1 Tax=uncultured Mailhella sp. TaxID=1981031 RepID=UPI002636E988|nr:glucose-1-phosphate thymidylyltransferase RfbA [uncultured Mailhella sp.]
MKGILLAGGSGTRLYPLTRITSKQLLPVYDKPMIYYPLSTLMLFDIREILIISTPEDTPNIRRLLGDGSHLGLNLSYKVQPEPRGIAEAFILGADFVGDDDVCLILGDNIFYMGNQLNLYRRAVTQNAGARATIFAYHVSDPERFGVVEFDGQRRALSIEEKPAHPKSNYASVGLYFYPPDVCRKAEALTPSARGELEITDLNNRYLEEGRMSVVPMGRGIVWLDAGTPDSLADATQFMQTIEKRQGLKLACLEEIAFSKGFIDEEQMQNLIAGLKKSAYRDYLVKVLEERHELY